MKNLSIALLDALKQHGARALFGLPGDFVLPFFRHAEQSGILPLHTLSHEPGVGFAADGAARYLGGPGVAVVTYGAGALNLVNAVAGAYAEKVPLVVISGAPGALERGNGLLLHHQSRTLDSQLAIFREITCDQVVLDDARQAPALIARALRNCLSQSRPVYIELPRDMVDAPCAPVTPLPPPAWDAEAVQACAREVLRRLAAAANPLLLVGIEIRRCGVEHKVAELARLLRIPVATTLMGRGLLVNQDAPLLGTYLGVAGDAEVTRAVEESDALLMLGVLLSDTNFGVSARKIDLRGSILALDGQVTLGHHVYPAIPIEALLDAMLDEGAPLDRTAPQGLAQPAPYGMPEDGAAIAPGDIARAVNDALRLAGPMPLVSDIGDCFFTALDMQGEGLLAPGYYATMGYGVPAGLGLQAASGRRPLILVGDGAFQMTGWELGNCARSGWDPVVIVFNNQGWEMLRAFQPEARYTDLGDWRFAAMAPMLGGDGYRVQTRGELARTLRHALDKRGRFQLIEVMLPRGAQSATLERFVAGVRRGQARP
ncbi:indolepyruvate/phenylpyruvate decarboxylase [Duganella sp. FT92W]|uniref:Indolepyruvate/phenylpyruvate decarboxylase n=1 Tax=Pseudoduganella rivuli TaxID=2666085 RepID=A0A7X2IL29_9BURK|nr:indolepyruvate/phenylpyruvate decarboxylase [Pseudoduganella rivuli]MRV71814.1 indolepyruvate/phenylpyruvate decarboxylase [Pseudoduganella rivuli]